MNKKSIILFLVILIIFYFSCYLFYVNFYQETFDNLSQDQIFDSDNSIEENNEDYSLYRGQVISDISNIDKEIYSYGGEIINIMNQYLGTGIESEKETGIESEIESEKETTKEESCVDRGFISCAAEIQEKACQDEGYASCINKQQEEGCKAAGYNSCIIKQEEELCKQQGYSSCNNKQEEEACISRGFDSCSIEIQERACQNEGYTSCEVKIQEKACQDEGYISCINKIEEEACKAAGYNSCIIKQKEDTCKTQGYTSCDDKKQTEEYETLVKQEEEACISRGFISCDNEIKEIACKDQGYTSCNNKQQEEACISRGFGSCATEIQEKACIDRGFTSCAVEIQEKACQDEGYSSCINKIEEEACKAAGYNSCIIKQQEEECKKEGYTSCNNKQEEEACISKGFTSCANQKEQESIYAVYGGEEQYKKRKERLEMSLNAGATLATLDNPCGITNSKYIVEKDTNFDCVIDQNENNAWNKKQEEENKKQAISSEKSRSQAAKQSSEKKIKYIYFRCKYKGSAFSVHEVEFYLKNNSPNGLNIIRNSKYVSSATFTRPQNFNNTHDNPTQFIGNGSRSADNGINGKTIDSRNYALGKPRPKSGPTKDGLDNYNNYLITITPIDGSDGDIVFSDIERIVVHNAYQYGTKPKGGGSQRYGETVESIELLDKNKKTIAIHKHNNKFDTLGKKYINYIGPSDPSTYGVNRGKYMKSGKESLTFDLTQV